MFNIALVTLKGVFRERIFYGICAVAILFLFLPMVSSLSLRQVEQLSVSLSLSLISLILLLLSLFLGGMSLWKDIDRRHTYIVLGLPVTRSSYLLGKFCGVVFFLTLVVIFLSVLTFGVVAFSSGNVQPGVLPVNLNVVALAIFYDLLKYILLVAFAFLFSSVSTSFFLPIFGTITIFMVGSATQEVYDFLHTQPGQELPALVQHAATFLYYLLPNFTAFDLKLNAIYSVSLDARGLLLTMGYFTFYLLIVLSVAVFAFNRRELK